MGNCHATDVVAAAVIQHPNGTLHKLHWPTTAGDVMRTHPGHYVASVTFHISGDASSSLRLIRVRILKHKDLLFIGQAYRLLPSQEVARALQARKQERHMKAKVMKQQQQKQMQQQSTGAGGGGQAAMNERERQRNSHQWRPSLQSISEAGI